MMARKKVEMMEGAKAASMVAKMVVELADEMVAY